MANVSQDVRALVRAPARPEQRAVARADLAPLPLRLMLGFGLMYHGLPKLFTREGHVQFAQTLDGIGVPAPEVAAWLVGAFEVLGGAALVLGAFVVVVSAIGIVHQLVALFTVHLPHGFSFMNVTETPRGPVFGVPGYEVNLLYIAGLAALAITGAGSLALDRRRGRRTRSEAAA